MFDDDFRENMFKWEKKQHHIKKIDKQDPENMLHGMDGAKAYKYDLPVVNEPIKLRNNAL